MVSKLPVRLRAATGRLQANVGSLVGSLECTISSTRVIDGSNHGFENLHVAGAATQVTGQRRANVGFGWLRVSFEKIDRGEHHSRRADPTLRTAMFDKRLLHRMKVVVAGDTLDRLDLTAGDLCDRNETTIHDSPVDLYGASAALSFPTPLLGPGELQLLAQHIQQPRHRIHLNALLLSVNREREFALVHIVPSTSRA